MSRDPMGEIDCSLYGVVHNNAVNRVDPKGLWDYDVHYGWTRAWAVDEGYQSVAAIAVAAADAGVDTAGGDTGYMDPNGQRYHFDRSGGGLDSRLERWGFHFDEAKKWCDWRTYGDVIGDVPDQAALNLGMALHPQQDWVAHGEFGIDDPGMARRHNGGSLQRDYGDPFSYPDRTDLDAVNGPRGRPAGAAMMDAHSVAIFTVGSQRIKWTEALTRGSLSTYLQHVRDRSKPCGECRRFFLGTN